MIGDPISSALKDLGDQRSRLRKQRDDLNRHIRNEEKKRARLIERARNLSNDDLLSIMGSRAVATAKAKPKAKGKAKAKAADASGAAAGGGG
jgi:peptidoglycan hydrolase CwlO-like protein